MSIAAQSRKDDVNDQLHGWGNKKGMEVDLPYGCGEITLCGL